MTGRLSVVVVGAGIVGAAGEAGARLVEGSAVTALATTDGRVRGVVWRLERHSL